MPGDVARDGAGGFRASARRPSLTNERIRRGRKREPKPRSRLTPHRSDAGLSNCYGFRWGIVGSCALTFRTLTDEFQEQVEIDRLRDGVVAADESGRGDVIVTGLGRDGDDGYAAVARRRCFAGRGCSGSGSGAWA